MLPYNLLPWRSDLATYVQGLKRRHFNLAGLLPDPEYRCIDQINRMPSQLSPHVSG